MTCLMKHLKLIGRVILVIVSAPVVAIIALAVGQLFALIVLLALPFILAFEIIDRKLNDVTASQALDELQKLYPDVPREMLREWESLMKEHALHEGDLAVRTHDGPHDSPEDARTKQARSMQQGEPPC